MIQWLTFYYLQIKLANRLVLIKSIIISKLSVNILSSPSLKNIANKTLIVLVYIISHKSQYLFEKYVEQASPTTP